MAFVWPRWAPAWLSSCVLFAVCIPLERRISAFLAQLCSVSCGLRETLAVLRSLVEGWASSPTTAAQGCMLPQKGGLVPSPASTCRSPWRQQEHGGLNLSKAGPGVPMGPCSRAQCRRHINHHDRICRPSRPRSPRALSRSASENLLVLPWLAKKCSRLSIRSW